MPQHDGSELDRQQASAAFGQRLRELRTQHGLTQEDVGRRTGLHATAIGRLERGKREPRLMSILNLARGLKVAPGRAAEHATGRRGLARRRRGVMAGRSELIAFGQAVRQVRELRGVSVDALASAAGIPSTDIEAIERGHGNPRATTLHALVGALGVTFADLDTMLVFHAKHDAYRAERARLLGVFGHAVRELREQQGLSMEAVAAAAGIAYGELDAIEAGHMDPGSLGVLHLAAALGVTGTALMLRVEELEAAPGGEA